MRFSCVAVAGPLLVASGVLMPPEVRSAPATGHPNVLMIICDDLNTDVRAFGAEEARTPNLDRLAASGTRFTAAFAQWASCMPSRYSFLSGWSPLRTGVHDFTPYGRDGALAQAVYLPEHFRAHGYVAARLDKVFHIGRDVADVWDITEEPMMTKEDGTRSTVWTGIEIPVLGLEDKVLHFEMHEEVQGENGRTQVMDDGLPEDALFDGRTARRARTLIREFAAGDRPFFLAVGFRRPHLPWIAHRRYFDLFPPEKMEPVVQPGYENALPMAVRQAMQAHYLAALASVDHHVGTLLDELERTDQARNTIVVVFGDHGYLLGEREYRYGKGVLWDRALQTALTIRVPGGGTVSVVDQPVGLVDLYPTLVELAGLPLPPVPLDGRSLVGPLHGDLNHFPDRVYSYYRFGDDNESPLEVGEDRNARLTRSVRTSDYRYTEGPNGRNAELIAVKSDRYAWHNLATDPAYAEVVRQLRGLLDIER